jgi:hypothetical protein
VQQQVAQSRQQQQQRQGHQQLMGQRQGMRLLLLLLWRHKLAVFL